MNEYERIALETRKKVSRITLQQQRELFRLYEDAISNLASKAAAAKDKTLTKRWLVDYNKEIVIAKKKLTKEIFYESHGVIGKAAKYGSQAIERIMALIFGHAGIDPGEHFSTMFSVVQKGIIEDILSGNLYKDRLTLSQRIWNHSGGFEKDIQYIINQAILEKKSAIELAKDLEEYVRVPAKRPTTWGSSYPNLRNKAVDYNAQRLARTSINHAYQTASIKSSNINPFVEGIEWRSALQHGRTCDLCRERHGHIYPKDDVPLDHANGLCTMLPYIPKDLDSVAEELRGWIDGANNPKLDEWYEEYGNYFAFKKL